MTLGGMLDRPRLRLRRRKQIFIELADRARDGGQWQNAAQLYRKALDRNLWNPRVWVQYGHALKESGERRDPDKLAEAEVAYRTALSLDPVAADPYLHLGHVLKLRGKSKEAEAAYLRAFALDPSVLFPLHELSSLGWSEAQLAELRRSITDGPKPHAAATGGWNTVGNAAIRCLQTPALSDEVALFVTHSPRGRLKPHLLHYLESLKRENISVILIVNADSPSEVSDDNLGIKTDGAFIRQNEGYDFAAWAHVLRLHPELFNAKILYLLNDSVIGPTNAIAFSDLLTRLRHSHADVVGLTENLDRAWHLQSYFLALKHRALSSDELRKFVDSIVSYNNIEGVINEYELRFASILKGAGLNCEAMFGSVDVRDPTTYHWKRLLESGFPFVKVKTIRDIIAGVDSTDWRRLLATQGYDVSLAERTLAEFSVSSNLNAVGTSGEAVPGHGSSQPQSNVLTWDNGVMQRLRLKRNSPITLADRARDAREWERAARLYRKALERDPRRPPIWIQYGHALKESGQSRALDMLANAEVAYRTALSLDPMAADPYLHLGHVLKLQGKSKEAEAAYLRAFALDPSVPFPLHELSSLGWSEAQLAELQHLAQDDDDEILGFPASSVDHVAVDPFDAPCSDELAQKPDGALTSRQREGRYEAEAETLALFRHESTFLTLEQTAVDRRFEMPYFKTYNYPGEFINAHHAALVSKVAANGMIDIGIEGWLLPADSLKLYELVYFCRGDVLELGTYHGLSTCIAALASEDSRINNVIVTVDLSPDVIARAQTNLAGRPGAERINFFAVDGGKAVRDLGEANRMFDFAFIDHSHAYEHVYDVCRSLHNVLKFGAFCLFHDFNEPRNAATEEMEYGVYQGVSEGLDRSRFEFWGIYGCTGLFRRIS
jgi:tetratricopeptide (TPR) repeat protein